MVGLFIFHENVRNYRAAPLSVATTQEGMFIKWPSLKGKGTVSKGGGLERMSWNDVWDIDDNLELQMIPIFRSRKLLIRDVWGEEFVVPLLDDDCATEILDGWNKWKDEKDM